MPEAAVQRKSEPLLVRIISSGHGQQQPFVLCHTLDCYHGFGGNFETEPGTRSRQRGRDDHRRAV